MHNNKRQKGQKCCFSHSSFVSLPVPLLISSAASCDACKLVIAVLANLLAYSFAVEYTSKNIIPTGTRERRS